MNKIEQALKDTPEEMVTCNECGWTGYEDDLQVVVHHLDNEFCKACPKCEVDDYLMDITVKNGVRID